MHYETKCTLMVPELLSDIIKNIYINRLSQGICFESGSWTTVPAPKHEPHYQHAVPNDQHYIVPSYIVLRHHCQAFQSYTLLIEPIAYQ